MKKAKLIVALWLTLPLAIFAQQDDDKTIQVLKSPDGYMYTDNREGAYFSIDFKGDSLKQAGVENGFDIDGRLFQIVVNPFKQQEYTHHMQDSGKEIALLKSKMQSELDYISNEVLKKKIVSGFEIFKNQDGKNYFLWHYDNPGPMPEDSTVFPLHKQYFLTFVANQHVVGVATPVFTNESHEAVVALLKNLADRIDVFGNSIDVDALYYKLDSRSAGKDLQYVDSANKYSLTIRDWLNITKVSAKNTFIATLPDIDNIQNAILVKVAKKADYTSLKEFGESYVPADLKMGSTFNGGMFMLKKEEQKPANVIGMSIMITIQRGPALYNSLFYTMETGNSYLLVMFTATPATYKRNLPRFLEFVEDIELIQ